MAGPNFSVPADVGAVRGNNLFHSFAQFNLANGEVASFRGPANIQNILARVTGDSASSIDGTIRSEISGANFFLMNPHGIVFGPHASLDVSGSFAATTADYLKLADGARFVASLNADDSVLSTAPVAAFGFLGNSPGSISVQQSTLAVPEGKSITLVGGDVSLDGGKVQAPAGLINVASVLSAGEVPAEPTGLASIDRQGSIALQDGAQIDGSGEGGGRIVIRGGRLTVDNSKIEANTTGAKDGLGIDIAITGDLNLSNGGQINSLTPGGLGAGGNIQVTAQNVRLDGGGAVDDFFNPTTQISASTGEPFVGGGPAKGGDISIHTGRLELFNSAQIASVSNGSGDAGRIQIDADAISLDAQLFTPTQITANTQQTDGGGKAGDIVIHTGTLDLLNGATILAASFGSAPAGAVDITAQNVNLLSGAIITAGTFGSGSGGDVRVTAHNLRIDGHDLFSGGADLLTGIQAVTTSGDSPAPGGTIHTKTDSLEIVNSASIFTTSFGIGQGGNIDVATRSLTVDNIGSIKASGMGTGPAGDIGVNASGSVLLSNGSSISTSAPGSSGGNISIHSGGDLQLFNSEVNAQAGLNGGNVSLSSPSLIYGLHSTVTGQADTTGTGFGNGGNLTLESSLLVFNHSALISKSSFGNGGNISILSDYFFPSDTIIDASAPFGVPGTVIVSAPEVDLSGVLTILPGNFLDASVLLRPDCGIRLGGNISSFLVMPRGGLPITPGGFVPSSAPGEKDETK